jgi:hypothetical protein
VLTELTEEQQTTGGDKAQPSKSRDQSYTPFDSWSRPADQNFRKSSGSLAIFTAIRRHRGQQSGPLIHQRTTAAGRGAWGMGLGSFFIRSVMRMLFARWAGSTFAAKQSRFDTRQSRWHPNPVGGFAICNRRRLTNEPENRGTQQHGRVDFVPAITPSGGITPPNQKKAPDGGLPGERIGWLRNKQDRGDYSLRAGMMAA